MLPTVHYNMGGIPCRYTGDALTLKDGNPDTPVQGLMAVGEAACVSVHGANRLGSNSLIDLVVFGKAAGMQCGQVARRHIRTPSTCPRMPATRRWPASTSIATPRAARRPRSCGSRCRRRCRTMRPCSAPAKRWPRAAKRSTRFTVGLKDIGVSDRSMIWNTDLVETLEFENLIQQAIVTVEGAVDRDTKAAARMRARTSRTATTRTG